jgi:hypothetical protein
MIYPRHRLDHAAPPSQLTPSRRCQHTTNIPYYSDDLLRETAPQVIACTCDKLNLGLLDHGHSPYNDDLLSVAGTFEVGCSYNSVWFKVSLENTRAPGSIPSLLKVP